MKRLMVLAGASALLAASVLFAAIPARRARPAEPSAASRAGLDASFQTDIRNLVYAWDPDDLRPPAARARALRDFIYETYESSAWIPQSLFEGNILTQAVVGDVDTIVREKVGLVLWPENPLVKAYGMAPGFAPADTPHLPLKWTVNCVLCHTAEIDGRAYFGAGTKVFDEKVLGDALKLLTNPRGRLMAERSPVDDRLASLAHDILTRHHHDKIDSLTRARSTAFAASHVELYMRPHGGAMPAEAEVGRGDVKVPPLVAHGRQDAGRTMVRGRQFSWAVPAHGLVDGTGKGSIVRHAHGAGAAENQGGVRDGCPAPEAAPVSVRDRRGAGRPGKVPLLLGGRRLLSLSRRLRRQGRCHMAGPAHGRRDRSVAAGCRLAGVHRSIRGQSDRRRGPADQERGLCGDAAHRGVGELSLPSQRQRAHASSPARPRQRAAADLRGEGRAAFRSGPGGPAPVCRSVCRAVERRGAAAAASRTIATGSTPRARGAATSDTTSGGRSGRMRGGVRSSST